jgi:NAD(P)H-hydrate epimerase
VDIGIQLPEKSYPQWTSREDINRLLPKRKRNAHKGTYGRAAIVAGSIDYTGAADLSAAACLRSGAGYTTLFTPKNILPFYILKSPEILLKSTNEGGMYAFKEEIMRDLLSYDSIAFGMGMGVSEEVYKGAAYLLTHYQGRLILDADGLNSLANFGSKNLENLFLNKKCDVILTPHVKEFSRLSGVSVESILNAPISSAQAFAKRYNCALLLKNAVSILTDGEGTAINATGNSGQAKGGSGDVLAGVLAGLCAVGLSAYESGVVGAYLVGKAAELAAMDVGEYSLTATDLISYLSKAFLFVTKHTDEDSDE